MNVNVLIGFFICIFEVIVYHAAGGIWFCCSKPEHFSPYHAPPNTMVRTPVDLRPLDGDSPEMAIRGHLSPSKTREALGFPMESGSSSMNSYSVRSSPSPDSRNVNLTRDTIGCWHECVSLYGYIYAKQGDDNRAIPITDGEAVPVEGRRIPECVCKLSGEAIQLIESVGLSVETFEIKRQKNDKSELKRFLNRKNIDYVSYTDFQRSVTKDLQKNNVPVAPNSAKGTGERNRNPFCQCSGQI